MATDRIGILLELEGYDGVMRDLRTLDEFVRTHSKKEVKLGLEKARREALALRAEINRLKVAIKDESNTVSNSKNQARELMQAYRQGKISAKEYRQAFKDLAKESREAAKARKADTASLEENTQEYKRATIAVQEYGAAQREANKYMTFGQAFKRYSSGVAHMGSAFQSAGNALTRFGSTTRMITNGFFMGAGFKALSLFTEGLGNAFERADTMKNYDRTLKALGMDTKETFKVYGEAKTAKENLDEAVQGLPTSLDEIMQMQKIFAGATGEMVNSTKTAIATNNAVLASGMDSRSRLFMQRYLVALSSGSELTKNQWQSMERIAPLVLRKVSEELGYASKDFNKFKEELEGGGIAVNDFLKAYQKVGISGAVADAARAQTESWNGLFSNIRIAVTRMGAGILDTLNQTFKDATGRTLLQRLLGWDKNGKEMGDGIKHWINNMSASIQEWIKANPDRIIDFFEKLRSIDWMGLLKGFAEGFGIVFDVISKIADKVSGKDLSLLGKSLVLVPKFGQLLMLIGGLMKGTRHVFGFLTAGAYTAIVRRGGLFGAFRGLFMGSGSTAVDAGQIATTTAALPRLSKFFLGWAEIATMVGGTAFVGWGSMKLLKGTIKTLGEIGEEVKKVDWRAAAPALEGFGIFIGAFMTLGGVLGTVGKAVMKPAAIGTAVLGALTTFVTGIADLDMHLIKGAFKAFSDSIGYLNSGIEALGKVPRVEAFGTAKERVKAAIGAFNQIIDLFQKEGNGSKLDDSQGKTGGSKLKALNKSVVNTVKNLSDTLTALKGSMDIINQLNTTKIKTDRIDKKVAKLRDAVTAIGSALTEVPINLTTKSNVEQFTNMRDSLTAVKEAFGALIGDDGALAMIPKVIEKVRNLRHKDKLSQVATEMEELGKRLGLIINNINLGGVNTEKFKSDLVNVLESLTSMNQIMNKLTNLGKKKVSTKGTDNISTVLQNIKAAFDGANAAELSGQIIVFTTSLQAALDTFKKMSTEIEISPTIKLSSAFGRSVDETILKITNAKDRIDKALNTIPSFVPKTINVDINAKVDVSGAVNAINAGANAVKGVVEGAIPKRFSKTGGVVYRANGGSIFKPRGTDTVPAMLTPGEYVHQKSAVDLFGLDFMRRVNNLDVRGAMHALMTRGGAMASASSRQSIVNNTTNNNQRVSMVFNGANTGMARINLGRYAGAL